MRRAYLRYGNQNTDGNVPRDEDSQTDVSLSGVHDDKHMGDNEHDGDNDDNGDVYHGNDCNYGKVHDHHLIYTNRDDNACHGNRYNDYRGNLCFPNVVHNDTYDVHNYVENMLQIYAREYDGYDDDNHHLQQTQKPWQYLLTHILRSVC